jgi:hypothetical protein
VHADALHMCPKSAHIGCKRGVKGRELVVFTLICALWAGEDLFRRFAGVINHNLVQHAYHDATSLLCFLQQMLHFIGARLGGWGILGNIRQPFLENSLFVVRQGQLVRQLTRRC